MVYLFNLILMLSFVFALAGEEVSEPAEPRIGSDIHGLVDLVVKNDYITPRGLLVTDEDLTVQILGEIRLDIYHSPKGCVDNVSLVFGIWNDIWTGQDSPTAGAWNELDWFAGIEIAFAESWKFRAQFVEFLSPPSNFRPENNGEFTLSYNDSKWGLPVVFNPYLRLFWAISGDSTIVVGKPGGTYYVELGLTPTFFFNQCIPITVTVPTWISMGPSDFWNGGGIAIKKEKSHFGVFSTGLKGIIDIEFIPKTLGRWYFDGGIQYYYLINENLLQAQLFTLNLVSRKAAKRHVFVGSAGIGFEF